MASSINASTTAGVVTTADTSGVLNIQTAGTTAISIDASQAVSFTNAPTVTGGTANGVAYLNGSKVLTTGSALTFNGTTFQSTGAANFATTSGNIGLGVAVPTQDIEASGTFRVQASATGGTGVGIETFAAGATAYLTSYNRTTSAYAPLALTGSTLSITGTTTVSGDSILSGTVKGASTISVGNATPSASGAGITFPATQSASTNANTLDDYEEGTYTPSASNFSTTGTVTITGSYTKIGNIINFSVRFSSTGTIGFSTSAFISTPFLVKQATGNITMRIASNSASFNGNQSGAQCNTDENAADRFFVGNFTTTSSGQALIFAGTFEQH